MNKTVETLKHDGAGWILEGRSGFDPGPDTDAANVLRRARTFLFHGARVAVVAVDYLPNPEHPGHPTMLLTCSPL